MEFHSHEMINGISILTQIIINLVSLHSRGSNKSSCGVRLIHTFGLSLFPLLSLINKCHRIDRTTLWIGCLHAADAIRDEIADPTAAAFSHIDSPIAKFANRKALGSHYIIDLKMSLHLALKSQQLRNRKKKET